MSQSCTVGSNTATSKGVDKDNPTQVYHTSVRDVLRATGKLTSDFKIRGISTIKGDSRPFYFVDKVAFGRNLDQVEAAVDVQQIKRVEVISSLSELAVYGGDGVNGVIRIITK